MTPGYSVPALASPDDVERRPAPSGSGRLHRLVTSVQEMLELAKRWPDFSDDSAIVIAQYDELKRQIPLLYTLLIINSLSAAYFYHSYAPAWLRLWGAGLTIGVCLWRLCAWTLFAQPGAVIGVERARKTLRRTTLTVMPMCTAFLSFALLLDQYGGPYEHAAMSVSIAITVIGCIFCLIHLPKAAMLVYVVAMGPYLLYHVHMGNPVLIAMAVYLAIVTSLMIRVLLNGFAGFTKLMLVQASLVAQQAEAERLAQDNARLALTDVLTGLPNRRFFFARLESLLSASTASGGRFAVGVIDLDRFKPINDAYGHAVGDHLLIAIGERLTGLCGADIVVARLGGDEFGLLVSGGIDLMDSTGQRICDLLSQPFEIDDHHLSLGGSVGLAVFPEAGTTANALFQNADYALYNVKTTRRGGCATFSVDHEVHIRSELALETALQIADLDKELRVDFQPIVCIETGAVVSVEALGRWNSPMIGAVEPVRFITAAERIGLMHPITLQLFRSTLASFATIQRSIGLSFNLSAHDIVSPDTLRLLVAVIEEFGVDPARITFELTETALMRNFDAAVIGIKMLRALGIKIALDDFGMGYSSLNYLHRLPLDKVKVDRSFIADMDENAGTKIIAAILGLCVTLELDCIIEGVETAKQLQQVRDLGYTMAQGYLLAKPCRCRN